jgi:hypothetical protein
MEVTDWRGVVGKISVICVSGEFKRLQRDLEELYRRGGLAKPAIQAHHDALLAILAEEESGPAAEAN